MEGWRSWGGASVLASCKLCLIGFINGYPGIMRPLLAGIFLKAVPRRGTPKRGHLLEHRCSMCVSLVCSWVSCESGDFAPRQHRAFCFLCHTHTQLSVVSGFVVRARREREIFKTSPNTMSYCRFLLFMRATCSCSRSCGDRYVLMS